MNYKSLFRNVIICFLNFYMPAKIIAVPGEMVHNIFQHLFEALVEKRYLCAQLVRLVTFKHEGKSGELFKPFHPKHSLCGLVWVTLWFTSNKEVVHKAIIPP